MNVLFNTFPAPGTSDENYKTYFPFAKNSFLNLTACRMNVRILYINFKTHRVNLKTYRVNFKIYKMHNQLRGVSDKMTGFQQSTPIIFIKMQQDVYKTQCSK